MTQMTAFEREKKPKFRINWLERDDNGNLYKEKNSSYERKRSIPHCVKCYISNSPNRGSYFFRNDLKKPISEISSRVNLLMDTIELALKDPKFSDQLINPYENCDSSKSSILKNQTHRIQCCTHYTTGLLMIKARNLCKINTRKKIENQQLEGEIDVQLMEDVNYKTREWKCAAKYIGHSTDLYEIKIKSDGTIEENFIEGTESSIEEKINEFFN